MFCHSPSKCWRWRLSRLSSAHIIFSIFTFHSLAAKQLTDNRNMTSERCYVIVSFVNAGLTNYFLLFFITRQPRNRDDSSFSFAFNILLELIDNLQVFFPRLNSLKIWKVKMNKKKLLHKTKYREMHSVKI